MSIKYTNSTSMSIPTKFGFNWPSGFKEED